MTGASHLEFAAAASATKILEQRLATGGPVKVLVTGAGGTGKSTVLARVRDALATAGRPSIHHVPETPSPDGVYVIDEAEALSVHQLEILRAVVENDTATVIVAARPRQHQALRSLMSALSREAPAIELGALDSTEIARLAHGSAADVMAQTAGSPALVAAALGSADPARAVDARIDAGLRALPAAVQATVVLLSLEPGLGASDVAAALSVPVDEAAEFIDEALCSGLVPPAGMDEFAARVHACAVRIVGAAKHVELERALLRSQLQFGSVSVDLALALVAHGLRDDEVAALLTRWAAEDDDPLGSAELYRAALSAGADPHPIRVPLAVSLARTGDLASAAAEADQALADADPLDRAPAVRVAAAIACHNGDCAQAVALYDWLGDTVDGVTAAVAVPVLVGAGRVEAARNLLSSSTSAPPTVSAAGTRNLALGILASVQDRTPETVSLLGQAVTQQSTTTGFAPDSAAALAALTVLHTGDAGRARSILTSAIRTEGPHDPFGVRHRLLLGWINMLAGELNSAEAALPEPEVELSRRDALFAAALRSGIARRSGDTGPLRQHWQSAMDVLSAYTADLYTLLPIGELWVAAARLRTTEAMTHHVERAFAVLAAAGNPVTWSAPLRWAGVHAAILANVPEAVGPHGQALAAAAASSPYARVLATAGRTWLRVLASTVDPDEVEAAARALSDVGLGWDATRLASQAALHAGDPKVAAGMLALARDLRAPEPAPNAEATAAAATHTPASTKLSDREREVATLLVRGLPYRDIGAQLFISAKTVEHHVARIRRRLGAESRSDMFSMLHAILNPN